MVMDVTENRTDVGAVLGRLTGDQRQQLAELDAAYVELLTRDVTDKADVEVLAEAVVAFYDGLKWPPSPKTGPDALKQKLRTPTKAVGRVLATSAGSNRLGFDVDSGKFRASRKPG